MHGLRVLLITPGINKLFNDNAFSYIHMSRRGLKICAISNRLRITKGHGIADNYEVMDGVEIHRIYKDNDEQKFLLNRKISEVRKIVNAFKPDIIFCSQQKNMALAARLKREFQIPILLLVEFAFDKNYPFRLIGIGKERFIRSKKVGSVVAEIYWKWLCKESDAVITCSPGDSKRLKNLRKYNKNIFFVPWPSYPTYHPPKSIIKDRQGIFIGALEPHKNITEFRASLPEIFSNINKKIDKFYIVGQGRYGSFINSLKEKFKGKLIHIPKVTRDEALKLIAESYFAYVPAKYGAWGFIEDCWAMKTPIIVTTNHYCFEHGKDAFICKKEAIGKAVQTLCEDEVLYEKIQKGGYDRFHNDHHADRVGEKYIQILKSVMNAKKSTANKHC